MRYYLAMDKSVGGYVKKEILKRGWSQRGLAQKMGFSPTQVNLVLREERPASLDFLIRLSEALDEHIIKVLIESGAIKIGKSEEKAILSYINMPHDKQEETSHYISFLSTLE